MKTYFIAHYIRRTARIYCNDTTYPEYETTWLYKEIPIIFKGSFSRFFINKRTPKNETEFLEWYKTTKPKKFKIK